MDALANTRPSGAPFGRVVSGGGLGVSTAGPTNVRMESRNGGHLMHFTFGLLPSGSSNSASADPKIEMRVLPDDVCPVHYPTVHPAKNDTSGLSHTIAHTPHTYHVHRKESDLPVRSPTPSPRAQPSLTSSPSPSQPKLHHLPPADPAPPCELCTIRSAAEHQQARSARLPQECV